MKKTTKPARDRKAPARKTTKPVLGYVIRHEDRELEGPLLLVRFNGNPGKIVLAFSGDSDCTLFLTYSSAVKAVEDAIRFEIEERHNWTEMYGQYVISAVYAA